MQIRDEQVHALAQAQLSRFGARMLVHIKEFFPSVFASLGEERLLLLVRHGVERGKHYGITSERDVCKLIDLMLVLGQDMERKFPRIAATLSDTATPADKRVDAVFDALLASLKKRADGPSP
jgi:hypothetical protein